MKNYLSFLKWNICHRKSGYGVHSPFMYHLITNVIQNNISFDIFEEIEHLRNNFMKKKSIKKSIIFTSIEVPSPAIGAMLFRIIHNFQCTKILEIGDHTAITGLYMAFAAADTKETTCYILEEDLVKTENYVREFAKIQKLSHLYFMKKYDEAIQNLPIFLKSETVDDLAKPGCIFINLLPDITNIDIAFPFLQTCMNHHVIWIINNIRKNEKMKKLWGKIEQDIPVKTTLDMYHFGIALFDKNLPQKCYKKSFLL